MTNSDQSRSPENGLVSGAALFTFDGDKRIRSWNKAAEELTGLPAEDAVGRPCWDVLCAHDESGGVVCHAGCSVHRLLCEQWPVSPQTLEIKTASGPRRVKVPLVVLPDRETFAALLLDAEDAPARATEESVPELGPPPVLTPRQQTVLSMLADGKQARAIADELGLSEMTVRNHIRAILRGLGCRSQLSAVAKARQLGLV